MSDERLLTLRDIPADVQSTHWPDDPDHAARRGCWASHVQCCIWRVETLTAERASIDKMLLAGRFNVLIDSERLFLTHLMHEVTNTLYL